MGKERVRGFRPHLAPLGTRVRGHDVVPPSFLRKQESIRPTFSLWVPRARARRGSTVIPAKAGIYPWDAGEAPPNLPPLGTRVRGHDVVPPSFLRSLSSWKRGAGIHPWPHFPLLGTRVCGHDVVPPSFLRSLSSWKRGAGIHPRPHLPPLGTRVRGHDDAPPSFLRKQESIPVPSPPSGYPRPRARRRPTVIPAKAGIHPRPHLTPLGTRVRGHDVVPPSFLRSLSSWKRGAGIHPWDAGTTTRQHTSSYRSAQNGLSFSIKSTFHARLHLLIAFSLPMALSIDS